MRKWNISWSDGNTKQMIGLLKSCLFKVREMAGRTVQFTRPFINGQFVPISNAQVKHLIEPWTGKPWTQVQETSVEQASAAIQSAKDAFEHGPWSTWTGPQRRYSGSKKPRIDDWFSNIYEQKETLSLSLHSRLRSIKRHSRGWRAAQENRFDKLEETSKPLSSVSSILPVEFLLIIFEFGTFGYSLFKCWKDLRTRYRVAFYQLIPSTGLWLWESPSVYVDLLSVSTIHCVIYWSLDLIFVGRLLDEKSLNLEEDSARCLEISSSVGCWQCTT
jgi:hypothetical protein